MSSKNAIKDSVSSVRIDNLLDLLLDDAHISRGAHVLLVCDVLQSLNLVELKVIASRKNDDVITHEHNFTSTVKLRKLMEESVLQCDEL